MAESENPRLILPANTSYLSATQCFIGELAKTTGLSSHDVDFLLLAIEEAIINVIKHAFVPDEGGTLEIICEHTPLEFTVKIRDKGFPFDPSLVQKQEAIQNMEHIGRPGIGFRLMKGGVDKLTFHNLGYEGKEIVLTKFLHQKHVEDYFSPTHLEGFEDITLPKEEPLEEVPYQVQFLKREQAIEVAQCAYRTYGYTYVLENVYYPERLTQMVQSGDIVSAVAVSDLSGEVMAHCALEFHGRKHGIPEIAMAFTKPKYRGMGCLNSLNDFILDYARETGLNGMYAKAVTAHTYSQKALDTFGFRPCGLLVGHSPRKEFARMDKGLTQRETLVLYHRKISEAKPMRIHLPRSHHKIIEEMFRQTGVAIEPDPEEADEITDFSDDNSHLECSISNHLHLADIYINRCGKDLEWIMHHQLKELCRKKIEIISIYLDLTDPGIDKVVDILEKQNCFFAGVFPAHPRPFLVLQYLNNVYIDYDQISIRDDFARELLEYVKDHDPNID